MYTKAFVAVLVLSALVFGASMRYDTPAPEHTAAVAYITQPPIMHNVALPIEAFAQLVASREVTLIDVRTPEEYGAGHLPYATLVNFSSADFLERMRELPNDAAYALYCRSGNRSGQARVLLADAGFSNVVDLAGGVNAWQASGRTLCVEC